MTVLVPRHRFAQDREETEKRLAGIGSVESRDDRGDRAGRSIAFRVFVPGYDLPTEAIFEYRERYRRSREGWIRDAYLFEYRRQTPGGRMAHHQHGPWGIHQHCEPPGRPSTEHYADDERLLHRTHDEFTRLHLSGGAVSCVGLRRKRPPKEPSGGGRGRRVTRR